MDTQRVEELPHHETPAPQEAQPAVQAVEGRGLARKAFEKITSLEIFQQHKAELFAYADRRTQEAIGKGAKRLASFIDNLPLSRSGQERAAAASGVNDKLAANTARFESAFSAFKDRMQSGVKEAIKPTTPGSTEAEQPKTPEVKETKAERREKTIEGAQEKRASLFRRVASGAADLIPFAGPVKMIGEALQGENMANEKLTGSDRIIHGVMGVACLALDATGIGEAARLTGKSIGLVGKLGEKLAEKGATRSARVMAKTVSLMATHPKALAQAEGWADKKIVEMMKKAAQYRKGEREAA